MHHSQSDLPQRNYLNLNQKSVSTMFSKQDRTQLRVEDAVVIDAEDTDVVMVLAAYVAHRHECYTPTDAIKADFLTYL